MPGYGKSYGGMNGSKKKKKRMMNGMRNKSGAKRGR